MQIDLEDELGYLEGIAENLKNAHKKHFEQQEFLEKFERKIRKHGYANIVKQSNAQKMQLEFEHSIAQNQENWDLWVGLKSNLVKADIALEQAKIDWALAQERVKLLAGRE